MKRALRATAWAVLLVVLVATGLHFQPLIREGIQSSTRIAGALHRLDVARAQTLAAHEPLRAGLESRLQEARALPLAELERRHDTLGASLAAELAARRPAWRRKAALLTGDGVADDATRELRIAAIGLELHYVDALLSRLQSEARRKARLQELYAAQLAAWERVRSAHRAICPKGPVPWYDLTFTRSRAADCAAYLEARQAYVEQRARDAPLTVPEQPDTGRLLAPVLAPLAASADDLRRELGSNAWARHIAGIRAQLPAALLWFASGVAVTFGAVAAIRALMYFAVAPWVSRRRPVLLLPHARSPRADRGGRISAVSQAVVVEPSQALLVHPRYLQSADMNARMRTRWLLSWRFPLSSLASGLVALTHIETDAPRTFVISATGHDAVSEIGILSLAEGEALVLQPRCLVGVLQSRQRPLRITRHWRLGTLNAWLTLQLRFLVFHGPVTLLVKGARGVRLETADRGRAVNQSATLGFGADVAYSQVRTETFFPYLAGRQALFNDRFSAPAGVYLYEETTGFGRGKGAAGRQLEGFVDALLKIVGL